jgi:hypothetical protein
MNSGGGRRVRSIALGMAGLRYWEESGVSKCLESRQNQGFKCLGVTRQLTTEHHLLSPLLVAEPATFL